MKRRAFITLLGGAAATWPIAARAQQVAMPVIGFLRSASIEQAQHMLDGLRRGLKEAGYVEGHNVGIDVRSAEGDRKRVPALLSELIGRRVALIVCNSVAAQVAKATINTVPIIFVFGGDPVKEGLVTSINRPEGNITGVTFLTSSISAKRFELLRELVPQSTTTGVLIDPSSAPSTLELKDIEAAAGALSSGDCGRTSDISWRLQACLHQFRGARCRLRPGRRRPTSIQSTCCHCSAGAAPWTARRPSVA